MATDHEVAQLRAEIDELRRQLAEATDTLRAIQSGEVDALVVASRDGRELYTLESAYEPYRVFVEHMQEGAASLAADGVILYANQRFADIVRVRHQRLLGNSIYDVLGPKNRALLASLMARSATQSAQADLALGVPGDEPVHVSLSVTAAPDGTRCLVLTDLTDRVRLGEAITTRDWLRVTLTSIGDAVVSCDLDGRITFFNAVAAALTGWLEGEAIGQPAEAVVRLVDETTGGPVESAAACPCRRQDDSAWQPYRAPRARRSRHLHRGQRRPHPGRRRRDDRCRARVPRRDRETPLPP